MGSYNWGGEDSDPEHPFPPPPGQPVSLSLSEEEEEIYRDLPGPSIQLRAGSARQSREYIGMFRFLRALEKIRRDMRSRLSGHSTREAPRRSSVGAVRSRRRGRQVNATAAY